MTSVFQPVFRVVTDGNGKFLRIETCTCDDGDPTWPGHDEGCPLA